MPCCASNSARCGPTPLIMRTSVLRLIVILECAFDGGEKHPLYIIPTSNILGATAMRPTDGLKWVGYRFAFLSGLYSAAVREWAFSSRVSAPGLTTRTGNKQSRPGHFACRAYFNAF